MDLIDPRCEEAQQTGERGRIGFQTEIFRTINGVSVGKHRPRATIEVANDLGYDERGHGGREHKKK